MVFPDFYRLPIFGLAVFCGKAWRKKIPERSEDDFFPANQPERPPCTKNAIQDLCRVKTGKHLFASLKKKRMRTFAVCILFLSLSCLLSFGLVGTENLVRYLL